MAAVKAEGEPIPVAYAQPVVAQPVVAVAQPMAQPAVYNVAPPESFQVGIGYTPPGPAPQVWKSDLCDCGAAGGCMCCTALCCSCVAVPQLFAKVLGNKAAFAKWFGILL